MIALLTARIWWVAVICAAIAAIYAGHLIDVHNHEKRAYIKGRGEVLAQWAAERAMQAQDAAELDAKYRAKEKADQDAINAKDAAYVETLQLLKRASAARESSAADSVRQLAAVASAAGQAASSPGDSCRSQDERIARGAELLSESLGLLSEGADLAQRLNAKIEALQP